MSAPKRWYVDIETAPATVYTFSLWKPIIGMEQIIEPSRIICFSAQWEGGKNEFYSEHTHGREAMLQALYDGLDAADEVVHYNGDRFDIPWISGELILSGFDRPSPFSSTDLFRVSRKHMRLLSGKLDYLSLRLLNERKVHHSGFSLWRDCLAGDEKAWRTMERYNRQDVRLMPKIYSILQPYIPVKVNRGLGLEFACARCGSDNLQRRGNRKTATGIYQQYRCNSCGGWSQDSHRIATTALRGI